MNKRLQNIQKILEQNKKLTAKEKQSVIKMLEDTDKELEVTAFKLERTEQVKKTTAILLEETIEELERKRKAVEAQNRELEIETSLERVRAVAMGMKQPEDMIDVCQIISDQLEILGVTDIRNIQTAIINKKKGTYLNYEYFTQYKTTSILEIVTKLHPVVEEFAKEILKSKDAFFTKSFEGEALKDWIKYRKKTNQNPDPILESTKSVHYYFFSIGPGGLGISTYSPLTDEEIKVFKRFRNVFELAYRRFIDIEKAIAQAREAQIEAALEKIRNRTLLMKDSTELNDAVAVFFQQFEALELLPSEARTYFSHVDTTTDTVEVWMTHADGRVMSGSHFTPLTKSPQLKRFYNKWKNYKELINTRVYKERDLENYMNFLSTLPHVAKDKDYQKLFKTPPEQIVMTDAGFQHGFLGIMSFEPLKQEAIDLMARFAKVFEFTYTRFLDLKKAEAQAKEAQIEAALERVRSRTMAMHKSEELAEVVAHLFDQLADLGIKTYRCNLAIVEESQKRLKVWATTNKGKVIPIAASIPFALNIHIKKMYQGWKKQAEMVVIKLIGEQRLKWTQSINKHMYFAEYKPENIDKKKVLKEPAILNNFYFKQGFFIIHTSQDLDESSISIIHRLARVFQQTYTRFLDLQKAEEQAREAQIEAALERVRSRTMAMHKSDEIKDVVVTVMDKMNELNIEMNGGVSLATFIEGSQDLLHWYVNPDHVEGPVTMHLPYFDNILFHDFVKARKEGKELFPVVYSFEQKNEYFEYTFERSDFKIIPEELKKWILEQPYFGYSVAIQKHSAIFFNDYTGKLFSEKENEILVRFAKVFDQAYIRFLDLQKAEAQAREAQIELSLERIRAQVTAMKESADLLDIVVTLRNEFVALGHEAHYFWHMRWLSDKYEKAMTSGDGTRIGNVMELPRGFHEDQRMLNWEKTKEPIGIFTYDSDAAVDYVDKMIQKGRFDQIDPNSPTPDDIRSIGGLTFVMARTTHGEIGYSLPGVVTNPQEEDLATLIRFAGVFDLAYRRFEDLKEAEARALESVRQAALDRVRAEIASMRTSEDLNRITPIIWHELETLEVPFIRCGVFIVDEENKEVRVYLTTPEGKSLGALNLHFDANKITSNTVRHWKKNQVYKEHWNKEEFINWTKSMIEIGQVPNAKTYQGKSTPPESLDLHFVPFAQGMLYVGNTCPLTDEKLDLVQTLADAFSIAYARYEDFKNIEEAKNKIEVTLNELKSTQAQLIHSEKMASLGELTAGIAHEIKNPLNFVNNFSEVSRELLDEMQTELQNKNNEEVIELIEDLKQNLEKINQHGKRADSIVKGMLLHSRGTSGEKMLTDINSLLDEYVNLAYHGMRAQNQEFNITMEKDYDKSLEKINVVPQDISRVFMNIISNACYAAFDKKKTSGGDFEPVLKVSTKNLDGKIEIRIGDNGNGIPANILDKIFQPFFTTKPTGEGTGLGLSLSYDIVTKVHGGYLNVETKADEGAEFIISLPK